MFLLFSVNTFNNDSFATFNPVYSGAQSTLSVSGCVCYFSVFYFGHFSYFFIFIPAV